MNSVYSDKGLSISTISSAMDQEYSYNKTIANKVKQGIKAFFCKSKSICDRAITKANNITTSIIQNIDNQFNKLVSILKKTAKYCIDSPILRAVIIRMLALFITMAICTLINQS